jgi:hypothetical protein
MCFTAESGEAEGSRARAPAPPRPRPSRAPPCPRRPAERTMPAKRFPAPPSPKIFNTGRSRLSRELLVLEAEVNTSKLSKEDFELECKYQAEQTSERATSLSEWLALFDTVDSIVAQIPLISHFLAKPKRSFFWRGGAARSGLRSLRRSCRCKHDAPLHAHRTGLFLSFRVIQPTRTSLLSDPERIRRRGRRRCVLA